MTCSKLSLGVKPWLLYIPIEDALMSKPCRIMIGGRTIIITRNVLWFQRFGWLRLWLDSFQGLSSCATPSPRVCPSTTRSRWVSGPRGPVCCSTSGSPTMKTLYVRCVCGLHACLHTTVTIERFGLKRVCLGSRSGFYSERSALVNVPLSLLSS